jgi:hypothetical protein
MLAQILTALELDPFREVQNVGEKAQAQEDKHYTDDRCGDHIP